ncbi:MAG: Co2+/Mg2+ efflux protein ApaG [Bacteroidia bacterium]|nr:Co2+/Mg2+ efflux protein ApaG [Bacteroidia bacterium]
MTTSSKVSAGIKVSVQTRYEKNFSNPSYHHYFFGYKITLENTNDYTVQLKRRHWYIFDSNGIKHEVEGEGVIGEMPILEPGESFTYESGCNLRTSIGSMHGYYQFERLLDQSTFQVEIPKFILILPELLN